VPKILGQTLLLLNLKGKKADYCNQTDEYTTAKLPVCDLMRIMGYLSLKWFKVKILHSVALQSFRPTQVTTELYFE